MEHAVEQPPQPGPVAMLGVTMGMVVAMPMVVMAVIVVVAGSVCVAVLCWGS
ncbi:MAG TPA: hypothetical protein PKD53_03815 [Chloroflexaceae bacterium]|nr:hypothetical protein [Chloroflexaceae bacterium]